MMIPRDPRAVKLLSPIAGRCQRLTAADWALKVAIILALLLGPFVSAWLNGDRVHFWSW